jgi:hypothetical protein
MISVTDPHGRILCFLERAATFSSKYLLDCTHEAEWTPFQTHYFSEDLIEPGIEPGAPDLQPGTTFVLKSFSLDSRLWNLFEV